MSQMQNPIGEDSCSVSKSLVDSINDNQVEAGMGIKFTRQGDPDRSPLECIYEKQERNWRNKSMTNAPAAGKETYNQALLMVGSDHGNYLGKKCEQDSGQLTAANRVSRQSMRCNMRDVNAVDPECAARKQLENGAYYCDYE